MTRSLASAAASELTRMSIASPKRTVALVLLVAAGLSAGALELRTEAGYRALLGPDHSAIQSLEGFISRYGGGLPLIVAWECGEGRPCQNVFDEASMMMAHDVTSSLRTVQQVSQVRGPSNTRFSVVDDFGLVSRTFVEDEQLVPDAPALIPIALGSPLWPSIVTSTDGSVAAITIQPTDTSVATEEAVVAAVFAALEPYEAKGFEFNLAGDAVATVVAGKDLADSTGAMIPFTVLVIGAVLWILFRSWALVSLTLATMGIALGSTFGVLAWVDWPQDGILQILAPLVLVVGVCDAVHLVARYLHHLARSPAERAVVRAAGDVGLACVTTTLTTTAGFLSFTTSGLDTFVRFGSISALGVIFCLILSFSLLPALIVLFPSPKAAEDRDAQTWTALLTAVNRLTARRPRIILALAAIVTALCGFGWGKYLRVDTTWFDMLGEGSRSIQWVRFVEERLGPSESLEIDIELPEATSPYAPATLHRIQALSDDLAAIEGLGPARSLVELVAALNRDLSGDPTVEATIGASTDANAQLVELIRINDSDGLGAWLSLDERHMRISVLTREQSYSNAGQILAEAAAAIDSNLGEGWQASMTGGLAITVGWIREVQTMQLRSFPTALTLVGLLSGIFLGSLRLGVLALIPTLIPVVATLGVMGWSGMSLDVSRAMIAAVILGVGVDDAIHLLSAYRECRTRGLSARASIDAAILSTGRAVVTTSLALSFGFLTLMMSSWQTISSFGFYVSIALLGALAASLLVLPALISAWSTDSPASAPGSRSPR